MALFKIPWHAINCFWQLLFISFTAKPGLFELYLTLVWQMFRGFFKYYTSILVRSSLVQVISWQAKSKQLCSSVLVNKVHCLHTMVPLQQPVESLLTDFLLKLMVIASWVDSAYGNWPAIVLIRVCTVHERLRRSRYLDVTSSADVQIRTECIRR